MTEDKSRSPERRILFLVSAMTEGGAERVAALLCSHWVAAGHTVTLMPTYSRRGACVYPVDERVSLDYLADRIGGVRRSGANVLRRLSALRRVIVELQPDVVISFLTNVNVAVLLATIGMRVPIVVSERTVPSHQKIAGFWRALRRATYWRAHAVVAQTHGAADWLERHCPGARCIVIPNPVVLPVGNGEPKIDPDVVVGAGRRLVLAVGRCVPEKGFHRLLKAYERFSLAHPDCDLAILGEGPEHAALVRCRDDLGLAGRVHLPGRVGNVSDWYARASMLVLTSHYEGFPNVLLEAMAYGVPVVSVDCPFGPADIVRDGVNGLLLQDNADTFAIAAAMSRLLADEPLRASMGNAAKDVTRRYSMDSICAAWAELFAAVSPNR